MLCDHRTGALSRRRSRNRPGSARIEVVSATPDKHPMTLTDRDRDLRHEGADASNEIRCPICGSPAFMYPMVLDDNRPVICAGCGAFVLTYGEMKRRTEDG
jgi:hypothetical protein